MKPALFFFWLMLGMNANRVLAADLVSSQSVRAILVHPLSLNKGTESTFIEIRAKRGSGELVLDRVPIKDIFVDGSLEFRTADNGRSDLILKKDKTETVWVRQELEDGWYPATEFCNLEESTPSCRYSVERNEETKSVILKIWSNR